MDIVYELLFEGMKNKGFWEFLFVSQLLLFLLFVFFGVKYNSNNRKMSRKTAKKRTNLAIFYFVSSLFIVLVADRQIEKIKIENYKTFISNVSKYDTELQEEFKVILFEWKKNGESSIDKLEEDLTEIERKAAFKYGVQLDQDEQAWIRRSVVPNMNQEQMKEYQNIEK